MTVVTERDTTSRDSVKYQSTEYVLQYEDTEQDSEDVSNFTRDDGDRLLLDTQETPDPERETRHLS